jgi:tripartite-type tricarboxylate transporter receptor subunit TctC
LNSAKHESAGLLRAALLSASLSAGIGAVHAQTVPAYPQRPIRFIVAFPAGSSTDIAARAIATQAAVSLGQNVVVDNRAGASGQIGVELGARAVPDGYTMLVGTTSTHALAAVLSRKLAYDPQRDFQPVTLIGASPYVLALHPAVPATTVKELIALAREKPDQLRYASAGSATLGHLAGELFASLAGIRLAHVPYKSSAHAAPDVLAGRIDMQFGSVPPTLPHIKSGKLRGIAVTGARRLVNVPQIPTVAESGIPGYEVALWMGVFLPARTRPAIVEVLNRELSATIASREIADLLAMHGIEPAPGSPRQLGALVASELAKWRKVALTARLEPN